MRSRLFFFSLLALLAAGQSAWAAATTKTVTYTITSIESINLNYDIVFTRSGDAPFDTEAPTTYTVTVPPSAIGQTSGGAFGTNIDLADGFKLGISWGSGSNVRFNNNCIYPQGSNPITYEVSCNNANYYVTHVKMTGYESNLQSGMRDYPNNQPIDTDYNSAWNFQQTYRSCYSFGQITVTYSNTPPLSIFESAGTDTYNIKDKDDLRHLANYVNNGKNDCSGLTFLQTQDITCDDTYMPIGNSSESFRGTYNGQGYTVSGITVRRTGHYVGLIGRFGDGTVENVILTSSTFTGNDYVGGIAGSSSGTIRNCRVENSVTIKTQTYNTLYHGGIAGEIIRGSAKIIGCVSAASVIRNDMSGCTRYGGIVGRIIDGSTVQDCLYTGSTVTAEYYYGTIVGYNESGTLLNNYNRGSLGSVGYVGGTPSDQDGARGARTVTLGENVMLVGDETAYDVSGLTRIGTGNYALRHGSTIYSGEGQTLTLSYSGTVPDGYTVSYSYNDGTDHAITGNTFTMPAANVTVTATLAYDWTGNGTADDPYQISNYAELKQFANIVNVTGGEAYAKLVADIVCKNGPDDMEYATDWVPIGNASQPYTGTFDGKGYTITGLSTPTSNSSDYVGLFGYLGSGGVVKDIILEDATITGNNHVGVIAGYNNNGTLTRNYYVSCSVNSAATNIGTGSGDCDGARSVHALSLPANVTASGESVVINSAAHYAAGTTVTLSYSGTVPDGYSVSYSYNDGTDHAIKGNTFTMPASNVTVSAQYISNVRYIDGNGIEQVCSNYTIIQSSNNRQILGDNSDKEAWYVVAGDVTVEGGIVFRDRPALILCDGATLTVIADDENGITSWNAFTIYSQSGGTGSVSATSPDFGIRGEFSVTITGGNVSATGRTGISSGEAITITGGNVSATGSNYGIIGKTVTISGGNVTATGDQHEGIRSSTGIYLGWTHDSDRITASSYSAAVMVNKDQYFTDGTNIYSANLNNSQIIALKGKTLRPYLDPTGGTTITLVQGTKDGVTAWWGTFCNTNHYVLSEGAAAYTLGSDYKLYRLGVDGRTIPKNTAVVIIASEATIQTYDIGSKNLLVIDHAPGGNILQGSNSAVDVSGLSGTPYVLSKDANGTIGFRKYTGTAIPANKAYYVVQPTP